MIGRGLGWVRGRAGGAVFPFRGSVILRRVGGNSSDYARSTMRRAAETHEGEMARPPPSTSGPANPHPARERELGAPPISPSPNAPGGGAAVGGGVPILSDVAQFAAAITSSVFGRTGGGGGGVGSLVLR